MRLHVYPLDAVRFFAAFCVLAFHLGFYAWAAPHSTVGHMYAGAASFPVLAPWTWFGWIGVEIFFVISGFVIANSANSSSPIRFIKSRVLRLYPAVWICACITLAAWVVVDGSGWRPWIGEMVRSLTLWVQGPWIDGVYWTLAIEMIFYAYVFLLLLSRRFSLLPWLALALVVGPGVYLTLKTYANDALSAFGAWEIFKNWANFFLFRHGAFFAVGIFMWLSSVRGLRPWELAATIAGGGVCCFELYLRATGMNDGELAISLNMPPVIPIAIFLITLALMFAFARAPQRFAPRSERGKQLLQHLGKMTYPLYLTHAVLGAALMRALIASGVDPWLTLAVVAVAVLALASVIAAFAEPTLRKMLRAVFEQVEKAMQRAPVLAFLFAPGGAVSGKTAAP